MRINPKSQVSAKGNLFLSIIIILALFANVVMVYAAIVTPTYYFHWVDPDVSVGLSTTSNRLFNDTAPTGTLREDSFGSNSCSTDDCPHYDFYSPVFDYDINVTGTQIFYFWSYVSSIAGNKDQVSIDFVKLIDFDPDDASTTVIATNDTDTLMGSISYAEYTYTLSNVNYLLPKGHRLIAEVHPYVSTDKGSGDNRNIFYYLGYDINTRNSRVDLSYGGVILTTNMTVPTAIVYGYDEGTFLLTCNATCDFGQCNDVVLYPQYCTGVGCTDFINMPTISSNLTTSNALYDAGNISNGATDGFSFTITEKELGSYIVRCNSTSLNSEANVSDETEYVLVSVVSQTDIEYENKNVFGVLEYETLDNITWINITAEAKSANASKVNTTLNILNTTDGIVLWGPDDNKECASLLSEDTTCKVSYDNVSYGYIIPEGEIAGTYKLNTTVLWSGTSTENSSATFKIYNIPENDLNSQIDPTPFKFIQGDDGLYNFSIHNPWSKNLTFVNVSINCPKAIGIVCNCTLLGQTNQDYCELENITSLATNYASFNVSTTSGTPMINYDVNVTVNYTNPGNQAHTWPEVQNRILEIQSSEDLIVAVFDAPAKVTRNTNQDLYGKVTYVGDTNKTNVWLNWSLPTHWSNVTGNMTQYAGTLNYSNTSWNNITASISLSAPLGQERLNLSSNATEGGHDDDYALIDVYANTVFYNLDVANLDQPSKPYDPIRGQTVRITAKLRYDNNTVVVGETVEFFDETDSILMGTNITDSLGWVYLDYMVPITSNTGNHTINVSYNGSSVIYTNPSSIETEINVHDFVILFNVSNSPSVVGNGYPVSMWVSINDTNQIETALVYINHSVYGEISYPMTLVSGTNESGRWGYNYTAWLYGTYSFYVWANDSFGLYNDTSDDIRYFNVYSNLSIRAITEKKEYGPNEDVKIKAHDWWNTSFNYRIPVTVSSTVLETDVLITETVDFTEHLFYLGAYGMSLDNNSVRIIEWNETAGINIEINSSFVDTPPPEIDLWEVSQDMPQPVDFTNGLNSTANTFGSSGSNDGWDWAGSVYGLSSTCVVFNNADVLNDDLIRITIGDDFCDNDGQASGAYGVSFYVSEYVSDAISNGGEANFSFDWSVTDFGLDSGDVLWIKARIGTTTQMYYLGSNLDFGDPFADGDNEVYFAVDPSSISDSFSFDVTQYITSAGWYYLDMGLKIGDWDNDEYAYADFDNITLSVNGSSYDEKSNALLDISWDMNGTTPADTERAYYVYFDVAELENKTYPSYAALSGGAPSGTLTQTQSDAEPRESKVQNIGNTDVTYRTILRVQKYDSGSWVNLGNPVLDDTMAETDRQTANNSITYLGSLWDAEGWNTLIRATGLYRVKLAIYDASMPPVMMRDENNVYLMATYNFTIVGATVVVTDIEHKNPEVFSINEYETGDVINWINITVIAQNAIAIDANITLNVQDTSKDDVSWGPSNETKGCGDIPEGSTCEQTYDNSTSGYIIPLDATAGVYTFYWNVFIDWQNGASNQNNSVNFTVHHMPDNFSSTLNPVKIFSGEFAEYNFTIGNVWSKNITDVIITMNCPQITGIICNCTLTGQEAQDYCNLLNVTNGMQEIAPFNISTNSSTPAGDYDLNVTVNYTNPTGDARTWVGQKNKILQIRVGGELVTNVTIPVAMTKITRNGYANLIGYANNTIASSLYKIWANWTLPSGWTNYSGNLTQYTDELLGGSLLWNNITANVSITAALGQQQIRLRSTDNESREDWTNVDVLVYANTTLSNFQVNDTVVVAADTVNLKVWLYYDNGTAVSNLNVSFNDTTQPYFIGKDITDGAGLAEINYAIPSDAFTGVHILNASFAGSDAIYLNLNFTTINITVNDRPNFTGTIASPQTVGFGYNVSLSVNVSDDNGVDSVKVYITYPNTTTSNFVMVNATPENFSYNFTDIWQRGAHAYYIWANNTAGETNTSQTYNFYVAANASFVVKTLNDTYRANEDVNLTSAPLGWWNSSWQYRKEINVTEPGVSNRTNWPFYVNVSTDGNGLNCIRDFRIIDSVGTEIPIRIISEAYSQEKCQSAEFSFIVNITNTSTNTYYLYYANTAAITPSYTIWADSCSEASNASDCSSVYYSRQDIPQGLDDDSGKTALNLDDEQVKNSYALPFTFSFFGTNYTTTNIFDNGFVDFTDPTVDPTPSESEFIARKMAAVIWDDYDPWIGNNEDTYKKEYSDRVIYTWDTNTNSGGAGSDVLLQMVLYKTGDIMFRYSTVLYDQSTHLAGISKGDSSNFFNNSHADSDKTAFYQYYQAATASIGAEETNNESKLLNTGSTNIRGYLLMQVQKFVDGTWSVVDTVYNSVKTIVSNSELTIYDIWNSIGWNTDKNEPGLYRIYAALTDPFDNILKNDNNENISDVYEFNITESVNITFVEVRIYDVTDASDPKTDKSILWATGLNETFDLFVNHDYRFEVEINNSDTSEANWTITDSDNITHQTLNSTWQINSANDIWYGNNTQNFTGGNWSEGIVAWNSTLGGLVQIGDNATFFYVFNVTANSQGTYSVRFTINTTDFTRTEYDTYNVVDEDYDSPYLENSIYGTNMTQINRGDTILVYAKWNETIGAALVEYNSTASSFSNHTITPQGSWTNYTISTDSNWLLGDHAVKIYANDTYDNFNYTLDYLVFDVWGWSYILASDIELTDNTIDVGESTTIRCKVTADDSTSISGYTVLFYNSTSYLGSNTTVFSGWASYSYQDNSPGEENLSCYIIDDPSKKYNASLTNEQNITLTTLEGAPPKWHLPLDSNITGKIYKGEYAYLYSNWTDNFELSYGFVEWHNGTVWKNNTIVTPAAMSGTQDWANFTIQVPVEMDMPNNLTWRVWANDTSGNLNVTENRTLDVWGWSTVSNGILNPDIIFNGTTTNISCRVIDEKSSNPISGYFVEFWNDTEVFNTSITDSNGWVSVNYTDGSLSDVDYYITCQIYNNNTLKYDTDISLDSAYDLLHVRLVDITPPNTNNYDLNATQVNKGGLVNSVNSLKIYAEWDEAIDTTSGSFVSFNRTTPIISEATQTVSGNWTNHTFTINQSWTVGSHVAKLNASDIFNNWNNTLEYLQFTVYGYGRISMGVPENGAGYDEGDVFYTACNVSDEDSLTVIEGYKVFFYEDGNPIGTNFTNSSGIAILKVNTTGYTPKSYIYSCSISDNTTIYYYESVSANNEDSATITLGGVLNTTIIEPANKTNVNLGDSVNLKSITKNPITPITPDTAKWYNTTAKLNPTDIDENYTWTIPAEHSIGSETIRVNVTKTAYTSDESNITIYVWGWSNISWQSPASVSNYSQGATIPLTCFAANNYTNSGIWNHTVSFYVYNETQTWYLGDNISSSTGNATYDWFADSSIYAGGIYYPMCNITDDADVYYNMTSVFEDNTTVNITETGISGAFEVSLVVPPELATTQVAQYRNITVNATVKCINGACGTVDGTLQYSNATIGPNTIPVGSGTPFYVNDGEPNPKTCGVMSQNDECNLTWVINATGDIDTVWNITVLFEGTASVDNRTLNATIEIKYLLILTVTPDAISTWHDVPTDPADNYLGAVNWIEPGTTGTRASSAVTVSLSDNSSDANGGVWIIGENLTSIQASSYEIPIHNISRCLGNLAAYPTPNSAVACLSTSANELQEYYTLMLASLNSGQSQDFVLFLDVPYGISSQVGGYSGTVWVKVNGTA